jgi:hypothetical protein
VRLFDPNINPSNSLSKNMLPFAVRGVFKESEALALPTDTELERNNTHHVWISESLALPPR